MRWKQATTLSISDLSISRVRCMRPQTIPLAVALVVASIGFPPPVSAQQDRLAEASRRLTSIESNAAMIRELSGMGALDQTLRTSFLDLRREASDLERDVMDREIGSRIDAIDRVHEQRLKDILATHQGWFPISEYGKRAPEAAYQIVQHSSDQAFKRDVIARMRLLAGTPELDGSQFARMVDRFELGEGRLQVYGTQGTACQDGRYVAPSDIEAPHGLAERRQTLGLNSMEDYLAGLQEIYGRC